MSQLVQKVLSPLYTHTHIHTYTDSLLITYIIHMILIYHIDSISLENPDSHKPLQEKAEICIFMQNLLILKCQFKHYRTLHYEQKAFAGEIKYVGRQTAISAFNGVS